MLPERSRHQRKILSEINVTPFVDIMLVLLVIFMVTAPFLEQGMDVELPESKATKLKDSEKTVRIEMRKNKELFIQGKKITFSKLSDELQKFKKTSSLLIYADKDLSYGFVTKIMSAIQDAGFRNMSLVTIPSKNGA